MKNFLPHSKGGSKFFILIFYFLLFIFHLKSSAGYLGMAPFCVHT